MNNTFNIKRFGLVMKKDFQENWKRYALQLLTMFGIMAIIFIYSSNNLYQRISHGAKLNVENLDAELLTYSALMFLVFGIIIASTLMEPMRNKTKRIAYLTNPASNFEKILSRWLIVTVLYIAAFFITLYIVDAIRVMICTVRFPDLDVHMTDFSRLIKKEAIDHRYVFYNKDVFIGSVAAYLFIQSLFILGSTFWEKATFIKTFSACVAIVLLYTLICRWAILISYGRLDGFGNVINSFNIQRTEVTISIVTPLIIFTLFNWVVAYFRFRESEIIKRL